MDDLNAILRLNDEMSDFGRIQLGIGADQRGESYLIKKSRWYYQGVFGKTRIAQEFDFLSSDGLFQTIDRLNGLREGVFYFWGYDSHRSNIADVCDLVHWF